ncbi:TetR family transcriptional regulator [Streptomyces sp. ME08-AFT2]|uniref:TetR/AcrR family transcriptional regulator n=1 Tax=Streptomyces sp. ME08-AFT2 TaxID=3028683 RepID=UPI0029BD181A|nr:TetR family transcriptional regulator [Streptomyces sp. ME08-AFT2]MDX3312556.1 TetR family transcriptional regulator [Streptomyces sp. ME08-AFT2]
MARRYDPERRQRIIDAAIRVVGAKGLAGLSHRSVAAEADVPLGSTTYHFATLDELMTAALRQASEGFAKVVAAHGGLADDRVDLPAELAGLLGEWLAGDRTGVELEYELYLAALRRPALRPVAAEWAEDLAALLARRTDPRTARALVALMDGICLQVLLTDAPYDEEYTREALARLLVPARPGAGAAGGVGGR